MPVQLVDALESGRILLLDGATGTELARRGVPIDTPEWTARALWEHPRTVCSIHRDYINAGADIITANTFRTHARNLQHTDHAGQAAELTGLAVQLARREAGDRAWVVGSQAPLEDCYSPALAPCEAELEREHRAMSRNLAAAGVDAILVETQNTVRESVAATRSAAATGLPVLVSFVCNRDGLLLSGETVTAAVQAVTALAPAAILTNCLPVHAVPKVLQEMRSANPACRTGAYANVGVLDADGRWIDTDAVDPAVYAVHALTWLEAGASLAGGCCGTTPDHIAELKRRIDGRGPGHPTIRAADACHASTRRPGYHDL